jgi:hypothetical protein
MNNEMNTLIENIKADYADVRYSAGNGEIRKKMIAEFNEKITFKMGNKYIKVVTNNTVWGFVVNTDNDKKFKKGDILKAAGWAAPARNFARGNIIEGGYTIRWTGAM